MMGPPPRSLPQARPTAHTGYAAADDHARTGSTHGVVFFAMLTAGISITLTRGLLRSADPLALAAVRFGLAQLPLFAIVIVFRHPWVSRRDVPRAALAGMIMFAAYPYCLNAALNQIQASHAALLLSATRAPATILVTVLAGIRLHVRDVAGALVAAVGSALALFDASAVDAATNGTAGPAAWQCLGLLLLCNVLAALYGIVAGPLVARSSAPSVTATAMLSGSLALLARCDAGTLHHLIEIDRVSHLQLLAIALVGGSFSYLGLTFGVPRIGHVTVAAYSSLAPLSSILLAHAWLHERVGVSFWPGVALAMAGLWLASTRRAAPVRARRGASEPEKGIR